LKLLNDVSQDGPTIFFPWAKNSLPGGPTGKKKKKPQPGTIFENNMLLSLKILIQE
jgi:hypothetical protein